MECKVAYQALSDATERARYDRSQVHCAASCAGLHVHLTCSSDEGLDTCGSVCNDTNALTLPGRVRAAQRAPSAGRTSSAVGRGAGKRRRRRSMGWETFSGIWTETAQSAGGVAAALSRR